jgi:hypothetical protein
MAQRRGTQPMFSEQPQDWNQFSREIETRENLNAAREYQERHPLSPMDELIHDLKLSIASIFMTDEEKENIFRKFGGKLPERPSPPVMKMPTPASPRGKD